MRTYLGHDYDMGGRRKVYLLDDSVEVDEVSYLRIDRTRVFFDDVLALTYHRYIGIGFLVIVGLLTGLFLLPVVTVAGAQGETGAGLAVGAVISAPFLLLLVLRLVLKVDVITIHGRRCSARLRFSFRKGRAREIYRDLQRRIVEAQKRAAPPPPPPAAAPPLPPGPPAT